MEEYLIDRETLGKFVDELIKKKALAVNNTEELNQIRESAIKSLDDEITLAIFGQLDDEQISELDKMFDDDSRTEDDFKKFFEDAGIKIEEVITNTMKEFGEEFLGGENA